MEKIENKTIVIISPDSWSFIPVSKHHYAIELAKHNKVYFINPPNQDADFVDKGVTVINQYKKLRGIHFFPKVIQRLLMRLEVNSIISKVFNKKIDIVWSFDTSRLYYLDLFKSNVKIAHIMDYTEHFYFKELVGSADFCLSVADCISEKMTPYSKKIYKINHGFYSSSNKYYNQNNGLKSGVYIGNLSMDFIDWKLIALLANENPTITFKFFGPNNINKTNLNPNFVKVKSLTNIEILNQISPDEVIDELKKNDFCFQFTDVLLNFDNTRSIISHASIQKSTFFKPN